MANDLPDEVWANVAEHLSLQDKCRLVQVSRQLNDIKPYIAPEILDITGIQWEQLANTWIVQNCKELQTFDTQVQTLKPYPPACTRVIRGAFEVHILNDQFEKITYTWYGTPNVHIRKNNLLTLLCFYANISSYNCNEPLFAPNLYHIETNKLPYLLIQLFSQCNTYLPKLEYIHLWGIQNSSWLNTLLSEKSLTALNASRLNLEDCHKRQCINVIVLRNEEDEFKELAKERAINKNNIVEGISGL